MDFRSRERNRLHARESRERKKANTEANRRRVVVLEQVIGDLSLQYLQKFGVLLPQALPPSSHRPDSDSEEVGGEHESDDSDSVSQGDGPTLDDAPVQGGKRGRHVYVSPDARRAHSLARNKEHAKKSRLRKKRRIQATCERIALLEKALAGVCQALGGSLPELMAHVASLVHGAPALVVPASAASSSAAQSAESWTPASSASSASFSSAQQQQQLQPPVFVVYDGPVGGASTAAPLHPLGPQLPPRATSAAPRQRQPAVASSAAPSAPPSIISSDAAEAPPTAAASHSSRPSQSVGTAIVDCVLLTGPGGRAPGRRSNSAHSDASFPALSSSSSGERTGYGSEHSNATTLPSCDAVAYQGRGASTSGGGADTGGRAASAGLPGWVQAPAPAPYPQRRAVSLPARYNDGFGAPEPCPAPTAPSVPAFAATAAAMPAYPFSVHSELRQPASAATAAAAAAGLRQQQRGGWPGAAVGPTCQGGRALFRPVRPHSHCAGAADAGPLPGSASSAHPQHPDEHLSDEDAAAALLMFLGC